MPSRWSLPAVVISLFSVAQLAYSQNPAGRSTVFIPSSSIELSQDVGVRAHTHVRIVIPPTGSSALRSHAVLPSEAPPFPGVFFETPASIACIYDLVHKLVPGCNPYSTTENPGG